MTLLRISAATLLLASTTLTVSALDSEMDKQMKEVAHASHELAADLKLTDDTKHNKTQDLADIATMKTGAQRRTISSRKR